MEHPFHSFYQVYCLADHDQDHTRKSQVQKPQPMQNERSIIASSIIKRLRTDPVSGPRIQVMENLCNAYLDWALYDIKEGPFSKATKAPFTMPAVKLGNIRKIIKDFRIPVVTARTPIDPSMRYENCTWIEDYEKTFTTAGGINLPKINVCKATDGTTHKQLVWMLFNVLLSCNFTNEMSSSKEGMMTCVKMLLWNKFSISSITS